MRRKAVFIARHACIRCQKMALPLIEKGHEVHMIANKIPMFGEQYASLSIYQDLDQLANSIKLHGDADIYHIHNEPSWPVTVVKSVFPDKPVILDVHDSMLIRIAPDDLDHTRISVDERNNFQLADGLVFPSEPMRDMVVKEFKLTQPTIVLPSYVPKRLHRVDAWQWLGGITYEGRVDLPQEMSKELEFFSYCDYTQLATELKQAGVPFHLYTPRKDEAIQEHYKAIAHWRGSYAFDKLIRKLARHDWGLVGNITPHLAWKYAMPNKLFEYVAAGVPVVAMNAEQVSDFLERTGFGITVSSVDELKERWSEHRRCREEIAKHRFDWCMENHIGSVEDLYEKVLS